MGWNISAYIETKNDKGEWELVTKESPAACIKYILDDFKDYNRIEWENLSKGMQEKFKKEEDGECYYSFYETTIDQLEYKAAKVATDTYTKFNVIIKSLGVHPFHDDDGEEIMDCGEDNDKEKLTYPINKVLVDDLQYALDSVREVGRREALDIIFSQFIEYGKESRIVIVYS